MPVDWTRTSPSPLAVRRVPLDERWQKGLRGKAKLRKGAGRKPKTPDGPSMMDYVVSAANSLKPLVPGYRNKGGEEMATLLGGMAADYVRESTPEEVWSDAKAAPAAIWADVKQNPWDYAPIVGDIKTYGDMLGDAAAARHAGDLETAQMLEGGALPLAALGVVPEFGATGMLGRLAAKTATRRAAAEAAAEAAKAARRPVYTETREGPYTVIRRIGAGARRNAAAAEAKDLGDLRAILRDPAGNEPARVADEYTREALGHGYDPNFEKPHTSLRKQSGIGATFRTAHEGSPEYKSAVYEAYGNAMPEVVEEAGAQNYDQLTEAAYRKLVEETSRQFDRLPVDTYYHQGEGEYPVPSAMLRDVLGEGRLNVFQGGDAHPYLSDIDPATGLTANEEFRAVHDYFGHGTRGSTFRPGGEEIAYASHSQMVSPLAQMALLSETRGQNSLVNYSPLNADLYYERNRLRDQANELLTGDRMRGTPGASKPEIDEINRQLRELGGQTQFAPQEPLLLPPEYLDPMTKGGVPDYIQPLIKPRAPSAPERAVHLSTQADLATTDPAHYGSGHQGVDYHRMGRGRWPDWFKGKTSFYLGPEGTVVPEKLVADLAPNAYETQLSGLYDLGDDPEGLVKLARSYNLEAMRMGDPAAYLGDFMRLVKEYGYKGYRNPDFASTPGQAAADVYYPVDDLRAITRGARGFAEGGVVDAPLPAYAEGGSVVLDAPI